MAKAKKPATEPAYKFPKDLSACIKRLRQLKDQLEANDVKILPLSQEHAALYAYLIDHFNTKQLDGTKAHGLSLTVVPHEYPNLKDWPKFLAFALKKGNDDLLQRSVNIPAWRERQRAKKLVPGTDVFKKKVLSVKRVQS